MADTGRTLATTTGLCPSCLEAVPGEYEEKEGSVYLTRECPDHGVASRQVWASVDHWEWAGDFGPESTFEGDLTVDDDHACLAVIEVTQDCNLSCSYCFAGSGPGGNQLPRETVIDRLETVRSEGGTRPIQFSGGEPTVHEELPEFVEAAREMGFEHVQVNTNGLRLASEEGYAERIAEAGVTAIYLQFDGLEPETYEAIREVDIAAEKHEAIAACRDADLPVILVPTVVPGVNEGEMGDIVEFALENTAVVRSVNFQPVAHFGRYAENEGRFSLEEAAGSLADQIDSVEKRDLMPVPCCSSYCQTATAFVPDADGGAVPLTRFLQLDSFDAIAGMIDESDWMEMLAGTPAGAERAGEVTGCCGPPIPGGSSCGPDAEAESARGEPSGGDEALSGEDDDLPGEILPVSFTGFMDADAGDLDRLDNCCISVPTESGDLVPFCAYNMTTDDGRYAVRNREGWGGRPAVGEPMPEGEPASRAPEDEAAPRTSEGEYGSPGEADD
ncbi:MAG: radical SAM protein [Halobacteriales archaeon]